MEKITLSLHKASLKEEIKKYAQKRGVTVSAIVENYLHNLIKMDKEKQEGDYKLPKDLDALLDGIEVNEELQRKDYKNLRDEMYESRSI